MIQDRGWRTKDGGLNPSERANERKKKKRKTGKKRRKIESQLTDR
jgi:hypothetical protein